MNMLSPLSVVARSSQQGIGLGGVKRPFFGIAVEPAEVRLTVEEFGCRRPAGPLRALLMASATLNGLGYGV